MLVKQGSFLKICIASDNKNLLFTSCIEYVTMGMQGIFP